MMKLLGAVMIMGVCIIAGYLPIYRIKQRIVLLRQLERDINFIYAELHTNLTPIPDLILCLAERSQRTTRLFYEDIARDVNCSGPAVLSESWNTHIYNHFHILNEPEQQKWRDLGNALGKYALDDELAILENTATFMRTGVDDEVHTYSEREKAAVCLGAALGMFFVIVLI